MTQQTYTPDWSKAPTDANWHARDSDGCGFWYNKRPAQSRDFWAAGCSLTIADNDCPVLDHDAALDNWRDTLTVRPFQDRDIPQNLSDYFSGKTPFITAYVDLLLARMANEERFSGDDNEIYKYDINDFDVVTLDYSPDPCGYTKAYAVVLKKTDSNDFELSNMTLLSKPFRLLGNMYVGCQTEMRTITELEAVEFRKAMEAVYG